MVGRSKVVWEPIWFESRLHDLTYFVGVGFGALVWLMAWLDVSRATELSSCSLSERTTLGLKSTIEVVRDQRSSNGMDSRRRPLT